MSQHNDLVEMSHVFYHVLRVFHNLAAVVGNGVAEKSLLSSKRYTAQEALAVGLVDKWCPKMKFWQQPNLKWRS